METQTPLLDFATGCRPVFEIQSPPGLCLRDKKALLKQIATFFEASDPASGAPDADHRCS